MARKTRKQRSTTRRPGPRPAQPAPPNPANRPAAAPAAETAAPTSPRVGGDQALVRAVEMSLGPGTVARRGQRGGLTLDSGEAAIPLDRVPYFTSDLVRVAVTGAAMIVLLVLAALIVIPLLVK